MSTFFRGAKSPKLYVLYCGLALLQLVCLTIGLLITHRIIETFSAAITENQGWSVRHARFGDLYTLASEVDAPGNAIFDSSDAKGEIIRLEAANNAFLRKAAVLDDDLKALVKNAFSDDLRSDLAAIVQAMSRIAENGRSIISLHASGNLKDATNVMSAMDREYANVIGWISHSITDIQDYQKENFDRQNSQVDKLRMIEYFATMVIVSLLLAMSLYGRHLAKLMARAEATREKQKAELARQAEELRIVAERAQSASVAKSRFLANMSHEIRTPMNGVLGMTDLLLRSDLSQKQRHFAEMIYQSGTSLLAIINDILDISRIESAKLELESQEFDAWTTVESCVELLAESAQRKGLILNLFMAPDVPAVVIGDSVRLRQILMNLIGNAIKFTSKGEIELIVEQEGSSGGNAIIKFTVRDTGIGIPAERLASLFKPFQQADSSITRRYGGTGLGLSITRQLVQMMGGDIGMESVPGEGTVVTFSISLPVGRARRAASGECDLAGKTILIVDDRQANREILEAHVQDAGGTTDTAITGGSAVDLLRFKHKAGAAYDVAIIDMMLPDMTGFDVLRNVRAATGRIATRFIMLSSGAAPAQSREAKEQGFHSFLMKPILRRDLVAAIKAAIGAPECDLYARDAREAKTVFGAHVLLAEDNPVNLEVARQYLLDLGCRVHAVTDGAAAVTACLEGNFDLVLMDCQMPVLDGLAASEQIREHELKTGTKRKRIVAVTANAFADDRRVCIDAGMDDYMSKPFSPEQLSDMLRKWLAPAAPVDLGEPTTETPPALDAAFVDQLKGSRPEFYERLADLFRSFAPAAMDQLRHAVAAQDADTVRRIAHSLKSSSANLGAARLPDICARLQQAAMNGWRHEVIEPLSAELENEFARVMDEIGAPRTGGAATPASALA